VAKTDPGQSDSPRLSSPRFSYDAVSCLLAAVALLLVLPLYLLPALLAGLAVYELVQLLERVLKIVRIQHKRRKLAAVGIVAFSVVLVLALAGAGLIAFIRADNLSTLLNKMADSLDSWRAVLPGFIADQLPADMDELRQAVVDWLRPHAGELKQFGAEAGRTLAHIFFGLGIGVLVSLYDAEPHEFTGPLAKALQERAGRLGEAFRRIVFAQARISAVNTVLTALYLLIALPLAGAHLPLAKTMLVVTFLAGLLPVVGNLISNTIIMILSLSVSPPVAVASLVFLVVIHKLEYFLNAHMIGTRIQAHAWELLLAMLVMEAAFGIPGLIAAPIYYAYMKNELVSRGLV
jgi:predicted PurR-regulated permease PerM